MKQNHFSGNASVFVNFLSLKFDGFGYSLYMIYCDFKKCLHVPRLGFIFLENLVIIS